MIRDSNNINKLALLILILFVISLGVTMSSRVLQFVYSMGFLTDSITIQLKLFAFVFYIFQMTVNIGSAIWLYISGKKAHSNQWLWLFTGLFTGILGIILWLLNMILTEIKENNIIQQNANFRQ